MHGALRDASVLRRMAMRTTSRDEQSRAQMPEPVCRPPVVRSDAVGLWPTAVERESRWATSTNRLANGRFSLWPYGRSVRSMLHVT